MDEKYPGLIEHLQDEGGDLQAILGWFVMFTCNITNTFESVIYNGDYILETIMEFCDRKVCEKALVTFHNFINVNDITERALSNKKYGDEVLNLLKEKNLLGKIDYSLSIRELNLMLKYGIKATDRIESEFDELVAMMQENNDLRKKVAELDNRVSELELRPPGTGGTAYAKAKSSFKSAAKNQRK